MNQVTRHQLERWLLQHGFVKEPGRATSHQIFKRDGVRITLQGKGPQDVTKKHVGMILRELEKGGWDRDTIRKELHEF